MAATIWRIFPLSAYAVLTIASNGKVGPIGQDVIHHTCHNRKCFNPEHLQAVTKANNTLEMLERNALLARITELEKENADLRAGKEQ